MDIHKKLDNHFLVFYNYCMKYYKPKIGSIIKSAAPLDKKSRFELSPAQQEKLHSVGEIALAIISTSALLLTALAPNIFDLINRPTWGRRVYYKNQKTRHREQAYKVTKAFYYLKARGYVELTRQGNDFLVKITQKGRKKVQRMQFISLAIKRPEKWDSHWWAVIADVPNEERRRADLFRDKIKELGFYPLQRTVWVHPFDPRDEVDFVSARYGIQHYVTTMRIDILDPEDEKAIKGHFRDQGLV